MHAGEHVLARRSPRRAFAVGASVALLVAVGSAGWAFVEYAGAARAPLLSLALAGVCFGVAFTVLFAFRATFAFETLQAPRPASTERGAPIQFEGSHRRRFLALVGGATASVASVGLLPLRSLGTSQRRVLRATAWRRGVRVVTPEGTPLRVADLEPGSAMAVVPSVAPLDANSVATLIRLRAATELRAYSRICTHAGCAVCVFRARESQLVCPCHYSVFDASNGGRVLRGPASKSLPELPVGVDADGFIVAEGDFEGPIGPRGG
jgi:ubiquinol-cytochrome c reductase iron-sulfur subunit